MSNIKAVLVGCGGMSNAWIKSLQLIKDVELVGLVDIKFEYAEKRRAEHAHLSGALIGSSLTEIVKKTGASVVFDVTVPPAHKAVTLETFAAGCHLLGEKPMAESMADAREMVAAAQQHGKLYAVIQNRRYNPNQFPFRNILRSGKLGELASLNADFYIGAHFSARLSERRDFRDLMRHVLLLDMAIHSFDQARFLSGTDAVAVYCHEYNPKGSWYDHDASAVAIFEMADGSVFTYRGSWCAEGLNTSWECEWRAQCTKGTATWDGKFQTRAQIVSKEAGFFNEWADLPVDEIKPSELTGHAGVIRDFIDAVKGGPLPQTICTDNIKSLAMVHAAIESATKRQRVEIKH